MLTGQVSLTKRMNNYGNMGLKRGVTVTYLTILYICLLAVFISAIGGFLSYKVSRKFFNAEALRYILGGIVALLLSYPMTIFLQLGGVWFYHLPIAVLAIVLYVAFYLNSKGNWKLIAWFGLVVLTVIIATHVYLIIISIFLS